MHSGKRSSNPVSPKVSEKKIPKYTLEQVEPIIINTVDEDLELDRHLIESNISALVNGIQSKDIITIRKYVDLIPADALSVIFKKYIQAIILLDCLPYFMQTMSEQDLYQWLLGIHNIQVSCYFTQPSFGYNVEVLKKNPQDLIAMENYSSDFSITSERTTLLELAILSGSLSSVNYLFSLINRFKLDGIYGSQFNNAFNYAVRRFTTPEAILFHGIEDFELNKNKIIERILKEPSISQNHLFDICGDDPILWDILEDNDSRMVTILSSKYLKVNSLAPDLIWPNLAIGLSKGTFLHSIFEFLITQRPNDPQHLHNILTLVLRRRDLNPALKDNAQDSQNAINWLLKIVYQHRQIQNQPFNEINTLTSIFYYYGGFGHMQTLSRQSLDRILALKDIPPITELEKQKLDWIYAMACACLLKDILKNIKTSLNIMNQFDKQENIVVPNNPPYISCHFFQSRLVEPQLLNILVRDFLLDTNPLNKNEIRIAINWLKKYEPSFEPIFLASVEASLLEQPSAKSALKFK